MLTEALKEALTETSKEALKEAVIGDFLNEFRKPHITHTDMNSEPLEGALKERWAERAK